jgi:hypothetical protein
MRNDNYLTEYYFNDTGDQFYPGCPASVSEWFQRSPEGTRSFFPQTSSLEQKAGSHNEEKEG